MTKEKLLADFRTAFAGGSNPRRFSSALLLAFVDFLRELEAVPLRFASLDEFFEAFPRQERTAQGGRANTLIVTAGGGTLSIRPFYNRRERFFVDDHGRYGFPSCAPHATQAWKDYTHWLEALLTLPAEDLAWVEERVVGVVLDAFRDARGISAGESLRRDFLTLLDGFDLAAASGEATGAAFQGVTFAFFRAESPLLEIAVDRVRTGSKRRGRCGDLDGYSGRRLALSVEAKHRAVTTADFGRLASFRERVEQFGALGVVAAVDFEGDSRESFEAAGIRCLSLDQMRDRADLWDPLKHVAAVEAFEYYIERVERNDALSARFERFRQDALTPRTA